MAQNPNGHAKARLITAASFTKGTSQVRQSNFAQI